MFSAQLHSYVIECNYTPVLIHLTLVTAQSGGFLWSHFTENKTEAEQTLLPARGSTAITLEPGCESGQSSLGLDLLPKV